MLKILSIITPVIIIFGSITLFKYIIFKFKSNKYYKNLNHQLDSLIIKLKKNEEISKNEIKNLLNNFELTGMVYESLKYYEKLNLFPDNLKSLEKQAEFEFVFWLMHPSELGYKPKAIEFVDKIEKKIDNDTKVITYFIFKFNKQENDNKFYVGFSGPYEKNHVPFSGTIRTFSYFHEIDFMSIENHVDEHHKNLLKGHRLDYLYKTAP